MKAYSSSQHYEGGNTFAAWLYRIVAGLAGNTYGKGLSIAQLRDAIERGVSMLSIESRMVLLLCDIQGFSYENAARILNLNVETVVSRLNETRQAFRSWLKMEYDVGGELP